MSNPLYSVIPSYVSDTDREAIAAHRERIIELNNKIQEILSTARDTWKQRTVERSFARLAAKQAVLDRRQERQAQLKPREAVKLLPTYWCVRYFSNGTYNSGTDEWEFGANRPNWRSIEGYEPDLATAASRAAAAAEWPELVSFINFKTQYLARDGKISFVHDNGRVTITIESRSK